MTGPCGVSSGWTGTTGKCTPCCVCTVTPAYTGTVAVTAEQREECKLAKIVTAIALYALYLFPLLISKDECIEFWSVILQRASITTEVATRRRYSPKVHTHTPMKNLGSF